MKFAFGRRPNPLVPYLLRTFRDETTGAAIQQYYGYIHIIVYLGKRWTSVVLTNSTEKDTALVGRIESIVRTIAEEDGDA